MRKKKKTKKDVVAVLAVLVAFLVVAVGFAVVKKVLEDKGENIKSTEGITVVPTMRDEIMADSSWCGTFQLVWNDMKNEVVKQDIVFSPQEKFAENLNQEDFTEESISEEYYFKKYGLKTAELKAEIEAGIKEKFDQESDILDDFDWSNEGLDDPENPDERRYFFYTMLYRKFDFLEEFDRLQNAKFANKYDGIEYFGIDQNTWFTVGRQIEVLYYDSKDDFAIKIDTKTNDEVIFYKNPKGKNFREIYENMNKKADEYEGNRFFADVDEFKAPKIDFNEKKEYKELQDKKFSVAEGAEGYGKIVKAIQSIKFSLNEKGGEVKSESGIDITMESGIEEPVEPRVEPRYFYVDDTFALFLREKGKTLPYFAGRVKDITKFQK